MSMKKKLSIASFLLVCIFTSACSDDDVLTEAAVGNMQSDMEILSRFIDINRGTNEYYINQNKKTKASSYITGADSRELEKVSPVSIQKCKNDLAVLNAQVASAMTDPEIAYLVFSVNGKIVVKKLRDTDFDFASLPVLNASTKAIPYSLDVYGGREATTGMFKDASHTIKMNVNLDASVQSDYYFFEIACPDTKLSPDNTTSTPRKIAFSGTGSLWNTLFIWMVDDDAKGIDGLFSWEFKSEGITPGFGHIAGCTFSY